MKIDAIEMRTLAQNTDKTRAEAVVIVRSVFRYLANDFHYAGDQEVLVPVTCVPNYGDEVVETLIDYGIRPSGGSFIVSYPYQILVQIMNSAAMGRTEAYITDGVCVIPVVKQMLENRGFTVREESTGLHGGKYAIISWKI